MLDYSLDYGKAKGRCMVCGYWIRLDHMQEIEINKLPKELCFRDHLSQSSKSYTNN